MIIIENIFDQSNCFSSLSDEIGHRHHLFDLLDTDVDYYFRVGKDSLFLLSLFRLVGFLFNVFFLFYRKSICGDDGIS